MTDSLILTQDINQPKVIDTCITPDREPQLERIKFGSKELARTIKIGYATRLIPLTSYSYAALTPGQSPKVGDLVLAQIKKLGRHQKLDDQHGRHRLLLEGDWIIGVYGHRYATDQFEGEVPEDTSRCQILSIGGVCGFVKSRHATMPAPTELEVLGFIYDGQGHQLNLLDFGLVASADQPVPPALIYPEGSHNCDTGISQPRVIIVTGASMNSGKTTTAACLIQGLNRAGYRVAAGKITGTACGNDKWSFEDHGAVKSLDFSDCGFPSTYLCEPRQLIQIYRTLYHTLCREEPDFVVMELADGIVQRETALLLNNVEFRRSISNIFYAAGDSLAVEAGIRWLKGRGYRVTAFSGLISTSPLARLEAEALVGLSSYTREELAQGMLLPLLRQSVTASLPPPLAPISVLQPSASHNIKVG